MDGVLHDTTRESVNAIADTNSAFSRCCPAPRAQFLFITEALNAVSALIFQVYLRRFGTSRYRYSMFLMWPNRKNMFNWLRSGCRAPTPRDGQHPERRLPRPTPLLYSELTSSIWTTGLWCFFFPSTQLSLKWFRTTIYSIPAILSPCLQMETQPRCIPRYFCNKVERICAIYLISTLADCTLPLWKNDIFTLSFSLRECRNTMYFHTSIALVVIEGSCCRKSKNKKSRTISHIWEIPLRLL